MSHRIPNELRVDYTRERTHRHSNHSFQTEVAHIVNAFTCALLCFLSRCFIKIETHWVRKMHSHGTTKNERLTKTTATCYIVALVALIGRRKQACKQFNADQLTCGVTFSIAYGHLFGMHILTEIIPNSSDFTFILRCVIKLANMLTQMNKKREKNRNTHTHTVAKHKIDCSIFFWMKWKQFVFRISSKCIGD